MPTTAPEAHIWEPDVVVMRFEKQYGPHIVRSDFKLFIPSGPQFCYLQNEGGSWDSSFSAQAVHYITWELDNGYTPDKQLRNDFGLRIQK